MLRCQGDRLRLVPGRKWQTLLMWCVTHKSRNTSSSSPPDIGMCMIIA
jgi:hypothetical protein